MIAAAVEHGENEATCRLDLEELFHSLSQPLTTLNCCLAVSLQKPLGVRQYQEHIKIALRQAELISRLVGAIRQRIDAGESRAH